MPVYLDHNATTPLAPEVLEAMLPYLSGAYGNASSVHRYGRAALNAIDAARRQVAALAGCQPQDVIFTSGGTEADNLAIKGVAAARPQGRILYGATEHPAVLEAAQALGARAEAIAVDGDGHVDWPAFEAQLARGEVALVSLMRANNETGVIHDLPRAAELATAAGALLHSDVVQAAGKLPLDTAELGCALASLSAHKFYGPKGIGALIVRSGTPLAAQQHGGGHEQNLRSGTLNLPGIVGFGAAAERAQARLDDWRVHCGVLRDELQAGLLEIDGVTIFGFNAERLPNTVQFALPGFDGEALVMELDRRGYAVSSGSACSSLSKEPSHVMLAMGVAPELARCAVRISLGEASTHEDVAGVLSAIREIAQRAMPAVV